MSLIERNDSNFFSNIIKFIKEVEGSEKKLYYDSAMANYKKIIAYLRFSILDYNMLEFVKVSIFKV
ncbi:hypothetical protein DCO58_03050 [Helicobacter saguini]|uniref:Uncharacterized protein n=1 Tax=Helicobacter saguini TaxID=1548018 RepID=A0A347VS53_9HELI|nr:hypothetical protein [Helicobacter saguini]MWV62648.1 hypothetical protein [Helicobacter saguini]MWV66680.1 hypothetical protein [Helicobacter saguini]MWV69030.1 hypothetical protein [Helicobacter saguini]MWV71416.1 hypothetical protein [Helicobacter saguini]TLD94044.1 hypothetical protein LS64_007795 [Helicobacter saguini]